MASTTNLTHKCIRKVSNLAISSRKILLLILLVTSLLVGINFAPIKALEIVHIEHPTQVRVGDTFPGSIHVSYEGVGPTIIEIQIQIIDEETSEIVGEASGTIEIPDGVEERSITKPKLSLVAPESPGVWNLRAVLTGGNEWPFSIEVVGDDAPPNFSIVSLDAYLRMGPEEDPVASIQVGDTVSIKGMVEYSLPEGSRVEIRYTTSQGIPTSLGVGGIPLYGTLEPWTLTPEGVEPDPPMGIQLARVGDSIEEGGHAVVGSGLDDFTLYFNGPLESTEWILYFRIVFLGSEGEETQLGSRDLTIEVSARTEQWIVIDHAYGSLSQIRVEGRYFLPEGGEADLMITISDRANTVTFGGHAIVAVDAGVFMEIFDPSAPLAADELMLTAHILLDGDYVDSEDFELYIPEGPTLLYFLEIINVEHEPEAVYGEPLDLRVQVNYNLPTESDSEGKLRVWQVGSFPALATEVLSIRGEHTEFFSISVPAEVVPPRNGDWSLQVEFSAYVESDDHFETLSDELLLTVMVIDAEEGIRGGSSDWMISNAWPSIASPFEGGGVTFWVEIRVETDDPLPQQVWLILVIDEEQVLHEAVTYHPDSDFLAFQSPNPWTATPGIHTAIWTVDPDEDYIDHNRDNNNFEFTFEVQEALPLPPGGDALPDEESQTEEEFDFYVTATPTEQTLESSISYKVSVELVSGNPDQVDLSLMNTPAGLSYAFNPSAGAPPYKAILTLTGSRNLLAGTYSMTIMASDGEKERFKPIILTVEEGAVYELAASPGMMRARPGETVEYRVSISSDTGYMQFVNLAISGLPHGVSGGVEPTAGKPNFDSIVRLQISEDVRAGTYSFTISGSGPEPQQAHLTMIVEDEAGEPMKEGAESRSFAYYAPLVYLLVIIAVVVAGSIVGMRHVRRRWRRPKVFCIECGKPIPMGSEHCPKCGTKQKEEAR